METVWREQMALNYAPLDEEHQKFILVVNAAKEASENKNMAQVENVFDKCYAYVRNHFSHEEALMERLNYPDILNHMKSHQIFIKNISELRQNFEFSQEDEKFVVAERLSDFLSVWFIGHVLSRDSLLKPYLQKLSTGN